MSDSASTMVRMGRKRRPPPKGRNFKARFAQHLHTLARDKTNTEIGDALGIGQAAVSAWFRGDAFPEVDKWPALAKLMGVKIYDLLPPGM